MQRGVLARRRDAHGQRAGQVDLARAHRGCPARRRPAGSRRSAATGRSRLRPRSRRRRPARARRDARAPGRPAASSAHRHSRSAPSLDPQGARHLQRGQFLAPPTAPRRGCGGRGSARPAGRRSATGRVEIGVLRRNGSSRRATAPTASRIASEIGTSMLSRRDPQRATRRAEERLARRRHRRQAIAAEIQWNRSRVASSAPDQTATDSSITFIIAKTATASRISRSRPCRSVVGRGERRRRRARGPRSPTRSSTVDQRLGGRSPARPRRWRACSVRLTRAAAHARHRAPARARRPRCRRRNGCRAATA